MARITYTTPSALTILDAAERAGWTAVLNPARGVSALRFTDFDEETVLVCTPNRGQDWTLGIGVELFVEEHLDDGLIDGENRTGRAWTLKWEDEDTVQRGCLRGDGTTPDAVSRLFDEIHDAAANGSADLLPPADAPDADDAGDARATVRDVIGAEWHGLLADEILAMFHDAGCAIACLDVIRRADALLALTRNASEVERQAIRLIVAGECRVFYFG